MSESQFNYTVIEQMHKSPIWDNHILKVRVRGKDKIYVLKLYGGINEPFQKLVFNREMEALKVLNSCSTCALTHNMEYVYCSDDYDESFL